jgi:anaerobic selenocysteine-containing dehydrogenase/uncharacterized protein (DUF1330 family)
MAVYTIMDIKVDDREVYSAYIEKVSSIVEKHGGRYLARGGKVTPIVGNWNPERIVLIEFPSAEMLAQCFSSEEYKEIAPLRERSTTSRAIVVEGCAGIDGDPANGAAPESPDRLIGSAGLLRKASTQELEDVLRETKGYTYCDGCNHTPKCGIVYYQRGNVVTRIERRTDFNYPNNALCAKGYAQLQELYHPERLRYPLKRTTPKGREPRWKRIAWDEALEITAKHLNQIKAKYGADKVCFYTGDPKEMRPPLQRLSYSFGSPNYGTESSTCFTSVSLAGRLLFGETVMGSPPGKDTKHCFIWGANQSYSRPMMMKRHIKARADGVRYFVVDPRKTPMVTTLEGTHLRLRPGTDGALALGMIHVLITEGLYDKEFVSQWVHGFEELKAYVKVFAPETVASITGVPAQQIREAARAFADGPTTIMVSASPVVHHRNGNQNMRAVLSLVALTGNYDIPGGVTAPPAPILPADNVGPALFCRRSDLLPKIIAERADRDHFPLWADMIFEIQMNKLPEYVEQGRIRAMLLFGGNAKMWPQPQLYQEAIRKMDFSLAVDYFYRPWTHDYVDLLLPAATCFERLATVACFGNSIYQRQPIKPMGEAREDWQIISDIGVAVGLEKEFFGGSLELLMDEFLKPTGVTVEQLRRAPGLMVSLPTKEPQRFKRYASGMMRQDKKPGFNTPTGKVEIYSTILEKHGFNPLPAYEEPMESPIRSPETAQKYPLVLMTGARIPFFTHSKFRETPWLSELQPEPVVNLNPDDASSRAIAEGDQVVLENTRGSIKVRAHLTEMVSKGMVDMFHGWSMQDVNTMIPRDFDPISGYPPYKSCLCEVKRSQS